MVCVYKKISFRDIMLAFDITQHGVLAMLFFQKPLPERDITNVSIVPVIPGDYDFIIALQFF